MKGGMEGDRYGLRRGEGKGEVEGKWRRSTQPGPTFSLVYATPSLLQHHAQAGLNPAMVYHAITGSQASLAARRLPVYNIRNIRQFSESSVTRNCSLNCLVCRFTNDFLSVVYASQPTLNSLLVTR